MANETLIGGYPTDYPQYPLYHNPQVYHLVKDESGESRSFLDRAFISFSYGGVNIEDFGLIATFEDNGKTGNVYANFEDLTSNYSVVDGQFYWGSHYTTDALNFALATDGITQKQLDAFKQHFRPGRSLPLILAEHPYRAILARVSQSPTYTLVPFQETEKHIILDTEKVVPVTVYRGAIQLSFIMDMPFWYGTTSYFDTAVEDLSEDELRGIVEDAIPAQVSNSGIESLFLGNYLAVDNLSVLINLLVEEAELNPYHITSLANFIDKLNITNFNIPENDVTNPAEVDRSSAPNFFYGRKEGNRIHLELRCPVPVTDTEINNLNITYSYEIITKTGIYNAKDPDSTSGDSDDYNIDLATQISNNDGIITIYKTAPADFWLLNPQHYDNTPVEDIQQITLTLQLTSKNPNTMFIGWEPNPSYTIKFTNNNTEAITTAPTRCGLYYAGTAPSKPIVKFTITPQFQTSGLPYIVAPTNSFITETNPYNVLNLTNTATSKVTQFKFSLPGFYQSYNQVIKLISENWELEKIEKEELLRNSIKDYYIRAQAIKICEEEPSSIDGFCNKLKTNLTGLTATFIFNSATGEAIGKFERESSGSTAALNIEENVGDMVCGDYLVIEEQNHLINGQISSDDCYQITTDYPGGLQNFTILYNNMYL